MNYQTPQEKFWAGDFGAGYIGRNAGERLRAANLALFAKILQRAPNVGRVLEIGANIGMNLGALHALLPTAALSAVEINAEAATELRRLGYVDVFHGSVAEFQPGERRWDLVFTKGVLIHLHADLLGSVYDKMADASSRYVMFCEYYNPVPVSVTYRGHEDRLFKRDFAGEFLDRRPEFHLVDYGFFYRRDPVFPQDDCTWFLLARKSA